MIFFAHLCILMWETTEIYNLVTEQACKIIIIYLFNQIYRRWLWSPLAMTDGSPSKLGLLIQYIQFSFLAPFHLPMQCTIFYTKKSN